MKNKDFSIFEFRRLPSQEKQRYFMQAKEFLAGEPTDSIIELFAANLWAREEGQRENE